MQKIIHNINATGIPLGRLASQIAVLLRGKQRPDFVPYKLGGDIVVVENVDQILLTGKKKDQQSYFSHSGYPKGEKHTPLKKIFESNPEEILRMAVKGMLPHNKLSAVIIKNLKFKK
ncbi:MAG: 50S ribosomal protein L13 [Parcubacteria group bacterium CG23_combo_of_CG06-09_8_20_14_all_35_6]|nr:MAG: 50S ribosomal protein L13 [Parcubacteria group bacterium CG23_combo_of_CG06-09_8_20_14_all_35_6]